MTLYLVRHAKAGDRREWKGNDRLRPLSRRGQLQAEGLIELFADAHIDRLLSSPYVRCLETLVPLAGERMVAIEPVEALMEGASLEGALALVAKHAHHNVVMSTHGDVMPMLLEHYEDNGVPFDAALRWPKGCTWVLETDNTGEVKSGKYLPPPSDA